MFSLTFRNERCVRNGSLNVVLSPGDLSGTVFFFRGVVSSRSPTANLILKVFRNAAAASRAPVCLPVMFPRRSPPRAERKTKRDTPAEAIDFRSHLLARTSTCQRRQTPFSSSSKCEGGGGGRGGGGMWIGSTMHIPGGGFQFGVKSRYHVWRPRAGGGAPDGERKHLRSRVPTPAEAMPGRAHLWVPFHLGAAVLSRPGPPFHANPAFYANRPGC